LILYNSLIAGAGTQTYHVAAARCTQEILISLCNIFCKLSRICNQRSKIKNIKNKNFSRILFWIIEYFDLRRVFFFVWNLSIFPADFCIWSSFSFLVHHSLIPKTAPSTLKILLLFPKSSTESCFKSIKGSISAILSQTD